MSAEDGVEVASNYDKQLVRLLWMLYLHYIANEQIGQKHR